jgi:acetolactate synthase-1/2/3 large subunit
MGYGIPMGIGAKLARPNQPCICVVGDGSMLMGGMDLITAVRYSVPIVIVVINNSALANVYLSVKKKGDIDAINLSKIQTINWENFAKSLGADGITVNNFADLQSSFAKAFQSTKPFVVDIRCTADTPTPNTLGQIGECY